METKRIEQCKIRKRGNSSSSSSSLIRKYKFKRAILVGKRSGGSSTTHVPTRNKAASTKSPNLAMAISESTECLVPSHQSKEISVSARKLAANLWEINKIHSPTVIKNLEGVEEKELRSREKLSWPPHLPYPSSTSISQRVDRSRGNNYRKRTLVRKKLLLADYDIGGLDPVSNSSFMKIEAHTRSKTHKEHLIGGKTRLKDVSSRLTTTKELLKVLNHICGLDKKHSSGMSLVLALQVELDRASIQVNQLIKEQHANRSEIESLIRSFEWEKTSWKRKERKRIQNAIACISEELEVEKKLRRQTERLNKKIGNELAEAKASLSKAMKELESEKRAKEILEQVCDELARGMVEDRAEAEQLKQESERVREEVEKEREMLQLADVLREERVQMKLSEAKYEFEEKNAAVERLMTELETYLQETVNKENIDEDGSPSYERIKELKDYLKKINIGSCQNGKCEEDVEACTNGEVCDGDESADSDLHSIELNMDNKLGSFKWNFNCEGNTLENPRRVSVDKVFKGRKSIDNIQWTSISLNKGITNDKEFDGKNLENSHISDNKIPSTELGFYSQAHEHEGDIKKDEDKLLRSLRDHLIFGSKRTSLQDFASLTKQWDQSL